MMELRELNCECVQQELSVLTADDLTEFPTQIDGHLENCETCTAFLADLFRIDGALQSWATAEPSARLSRRVIAAVEAADPAPAPAYRIDGRRRGKLLRLAAVTCTLIGIAAVTLRNHGMGDLVGSAQAAVERMGAAYAQVHTAHVTYWTRQYWAATPDTDGRPMEHTFPTLHKVEEMWHEGNSFRKEGIWGSRLIVENPNAKPGPDGSIGWYYRYDSKSHKVIKMEERGRQPALYTIKEMTGVDPDDPKLHATVVATGTVSGRLIREIKLDLSSVESKDVIIPLRALCWVDVETNLPARIEGQMRVGNNDWETECRYDLEFNQHLPASLFDPSTLHHEGWSLNDSFTQNSRTHKRRLPIPGASSIHEATIGSIFWRGDPAVADVVRPGLGVPASTDLLAGISEWRIDEKSELWGQVLLRAGHDFVLRASGAPEVRLTWDGGADSVTGASNEPDFSGMGLKVVDGDRAKLRPGTVYHLVPVNQKPGFTWVVPSSVTVRVP